MSEGLHSLSEREKQTLRLLLDGHDAKSVASALGLSVHTVHERLRDARRKLGVSSSREAARQLAAAERYDPKNFVDEQFGVVTAAAKSPQSSVGPSPRSLSLVRGNRLIWLSGGMLIMSMLIAVVALSSLALGTVTPVAQVANEGALASDAKPALDWLALVDSERWTQSWQDAGALFRSQVAETTWVTMAKGVRQPLGAVTNRAVLSIDKSTTLPGMPVGEYRVVRFTTSFANKPGAIETLALVREANGWKVIGYFIR